MATSDVWGLTYEEADSLLPGEDTYVVLTVAGFDDPLVSLSENLENIPEHSDAQNHSQLE